MMRLGPITVFALSAVACGGSGEMDSKSLGCEEVPAGLVDALTGAAAPHALRNFKMVKSQDFEALWFISALDETGVKATWASNWPKRGAGIIMSVDDNAYELTRLGRGETTDAKLSKHDHGWLQSRQCVDLNADTDLPVVSKE